MKVGERHFDVALDATLRACLTRWGSGPLLPVRSGDLRKKRFKRPRRTLIVFVVDASDSMGQGTYARMKAAKGAAFAILTQAHLKRHRVGMVAFRDQSAQVVLPPTSSISLARQRLKSMPTGGATPFADGLMKAWRMIQTERHKDPSLAPLMVVISDGEANVPYDPRAKHIGVANELRWICGRLGADRIHSIVIDTKPRREGSDDMVSIARDLNAAYYHLDSLKAGNVVAVVTQVDDIGFKRRNFA